jgi:hypothetical protein
MRRKDDYFGCLAWGLVAFVVGAVYFLSRGAPTP